MLAPQFKHSLHKSWCGRVDVGLQFWASAYRQRRYTTMMNDAINKWFEDENVRSFISSAEYFTDEPSNLSLRNVLHLDDKNEKPFTKDLFLSKHESVIKLLDDVSISIRAYQQFQDILGIVEQKDMDIINRHYCYYESLVYLRESTVSWLDKNVLSSIALLRPFMELSLLHIYWHLKCEYTSYKNYYEWLNGERGKPPFKNLLDYIFKTIEIPNEIDSKRMIFLKEVLSNSYSFLCNYNHTPKIEDSMTTLGMTENNITPNAYSLYSSQLIILLKQLTYLYILVYPHSLYPFNQIKYIGYHGTVSIYFDEINYKIINKFLGDENLSKLKLGFNQDTRIISHKKKIQSFEPLSKDILNKSWQKFSSNANMKAPDTEKSEERFIYHKSYTRSLNKAINYICKKTSFDDISDEYFTNLEHKMNNW